MTYRVKRGLGVSVCVFMMGAFLGCDGPQTKSLDTAYYPKLPAGIETFEAAIKDLAGLLENRSGSFLIRVEPDYFTQHEFKDNGNPSGLIKFEAGAVSRGLWHYFSNPLCLLIENMNSIAVRDDMLEISAFVFVLYADLPDLPITVTMHGRDKKPWAGISLGNQIRISVLGPEWTDGQRIADDLFYIQQNIEKHQDDQFALFEAKAAQYRAMEVKSVITEEQRKWIVQGDALTQQKEYGRAIQFFKAVERDHVSYPRAYLNMALLSAELHRFKPAISYMKQYLLLVPDTQEARDAQDKIYEWELMVKK